MSDQLVNAPKFRGTGNTLVKWGVPTVCVFALLALGAYVAVMKYRFQMHKGPNTEMKHALLRLAINPPDDVSEHHWAFCIHWAWNLHANYSHPDYIHRDDLQRLATELNRRVDAGADLSDIEWYWDAYVDAAPEARQYDHWRPMSDNNPYLPRGDPAALDEWRDQYQREVVNP